MSDDSDTTDMPSPSLLNNLRQFRFQKKLPPKLAAVNDHPNNGTTSRLDVNSSPEVEVILHRKKCGHRIQYSDSEDETVTKETQKSEKDVTTKEINLTFLRDAFPEMDRMVLQDVLVSTNWNVEAAMSQLCQDNGTNQKKRSLSRDRDINHSPPRKKERCKDIDDIEVDKYDDDNDEDTNIYEKFYDSDDSDQEISNDLTEDKKRVIEFLSTATVQELRAMPSCTQKRADAIIEQRPFLDWKDLVEKFKNRKFLSTQLLNAAKEILYIRQEVDTLMKKCMKLATRMERAVLTGGSSVKQQPTLLSEGLSLSGYQLIGLNWLLVMHIQQLNGILADEMGLGKTVQVIAFLAHLKEHGMSGDGPHLIVVPSSTLENWNNEFKRWCPSLHVISYYGSFEDRKAMRISWLREGGLENVDVILTVYGIVCSTNEDRKLFRVISLHYMVLDEAHMLKNMTTQRYENFMRINARHRILLTGTPVQNNLLELMSLLIFVMPNMFAGKKDHLKLLFSKCPKQAVSDNGEDEKQPMFEQQQVTQARRIMKPFVLRRLKTDVLKDLPSKTEETIYCALTESQQIKYDQLIKEFSESAGQGNSDISGMTMMMQLRKMANHPCLIRFYYSDLQLEEMAARLAVDSLYKQDNKEYIFEDLAIMSDFQLHQLAHSYTCLAGLYLPPSLILESGKFQRFDEMLPTMKQESHRVLIFSQFVIMLDVIEEYLKARGHRYLRLDGSTPVTTRQDLIDTYNQDPAIFVFLLSTRAGGMGINLTAADTVILHDIDFNPYNDKQAEDRCHRVGQTRSVKVMRLISTGTIEEGMYQAAQEKLSLEREINSTEGNESTEAKNVVCLLKQTLGLDSARASTLLNSQQES